METMKVEKPKANPNRVLIKHLWFLEAQDFPGAQETHIACEPDPTPHGKSFVCHMLKDERCAFEVRYHIGGKENCVMTFPHERVKRYEKA